MANLYYMELRLNENEISNLGEDFLLERLDLLDSAIDSTIIGLSSSVNAISLVGSPDVEHGVEDAHFRGSSPILNT